MTATVRRATRKALDAVRCEVEGYCASVGHDVDAATAERGLGPMLELVDPPEGDAVVTCGSSIEVGGLEVVFDRMSGELR